LLLVSGPLFSGAPAPNPPALETAATAKPLSAPTNPDRFSNLPHLLLVDTKQVVYAPTQWDRSDWIIFGTGAAAVLGTALLLDHPVAGFMADHGKASWDSPAKVVQNLGGTPSVFIAGGLYLGGLAFKDSQVRATGVDAMAAMGISQLLLAIPLKVAVGRSRPSADQGTHDFHPFNGGQSFPSGHTTQAFALASVISGHADETWVSGVSYGLAGLVGLARVEQKAHFMSDVVMGALIGTGVGKSVVHGNQALRASAGSKRFVASFNPTLGPGQCGFNLTVKY
jgi:membrane-associated phospholipid phosphatase